MPSPLGCVCIHGGYSLKITNLYVVCFNLRSLVQLNTESLTACVILMLSCNGRVMPEEEPILSE